MSGLVWSVLWCHVVYTWSPIGRVERATAIGPKNFAKTRDNRCANHQVRCRRLIFSCYSIGRVLISDAICGGHWFLMGVALRRASTNLNIARILLTL